MRCDLGVVQSLRDALQDFAFARRQIRERLTGATLDRLRPLWTAALTEGLRFERTETGRHVTDFRPEWWLGAWPVPARCA